MLDSLFVKLRQALVAGDDLLDLADSPEMTRILQSDLLRDRLRRFDDAAYRLEESAGLYRGDKVVILGQWEDWICTLTSHGGTGDFVYTNPYPSLFAPIRTSGPVALKVYDVTPPADESIEAFSTARIRHAQTLNLERGAFWAPKLNQTFHRLPGSEDAVFLRFVGPAYAPYVHGFRAADETYAYSSFASEQHTGVDMFCRLLKEIASAPGLVPLLSLEERQLFKGIAMDTVRSEMAPDVSRWMALQALGRVDGDSAAGVLADWAGQAGPLQASARRTLSRMKEAS